MNRQQLFICVLCLVVTAICSDLDVLLKHKKDAPISREESSILTSLFKQYNTKADELLSSAEFDSFFANSFGFDEGIKMMDIDNDGQFAYEEIVYSVKQMQSVPLLNSDAMTSDLKQIFGSKLTEETKAECIAQVMFYMLDDAQSNAVSTGEMMESVTTLEYENAEHGDAGMTVDEFQTSFFESPSFFSYQSLMMDAAKGMVDFKAIGEAFEPKIAASKIAEMELQFAPHEFDNEIKEYFGGRRRLVVIPCLASWVFAALCIVIVVVVVVVAATNNNNNGGGGNGGGCYDINSRVLRLRDGETEDVSIQDVRVGDYVFDGNAFSKIYYIDTSDVHKKVRMLQLFFGGNGQSISLTPHHLVYRNNELQPVRSDEIAIGDGLVGYYDDLVGDAYNYTVTDILDFGGYPIDPITMSGKLMVNNVTTSVFTKSFAEHQRLQKQSEPFRWISSNVNEELASNMIDFYYQNVYRLGRTNAVFDYEATAWVAAVAIPAFFALGFGKVVSFLIR